MSNEWFQFRQFLIRQDQTAMKVGTDGVLLGAWANCKDCVTILDVGTGTGLIALMVAQRNPEAIITALEIDAAATNQAKKNVQACLWPDRIKVILADFRTWMPASDQKFDLVICNPPFFTRSLKNPDTQRATARHDDDLPLSHLIPKSAGLLNPNGKLALILPVGRIQDAMTMAVENQLYLLRRMNIRGDINTPVKRVLLGWGREDGTPETAELVIETGVRGVYTKDYLRLTGEFYLDQTRSSVKGSRPSG